MIYIRSCLFCFAPGLDSQALYEVQDGLPQRAIRDILELGHDSGLGSYKVRFEERLCKNVFGGIAKLRANRLDGGAVVLSEVGNRFEVWRQASRQPHHFNIAARFAL